MKDSEFHWTIDADLESANGINDFTAKFAVIERLDKIVDLLERLLDAQTQS